MKKELEKKIKKAQSEEELLGILDAADPHALSDEELELVTGGSEHNPNWVLI